MVLSDPKISAGLLAGIVLLTAVISAEGAEYHVSKAGNDANAGTLQQPWLTIGKAASKTLAGDTVIIADGDYDEHVHETSPGEVDNYIVYRAANRGKVSLRAFRLSAPCIKLDGFKLSRYSGAGNTWGAAVRVEAAADKAIVTNCEIVDLPAVTANDFRFIASERRVVSQSSDFVAAGFVPGSKVYLGASGAQVNGVPLYFANHDTEWAVQSVERTSLVLTAGNSEFLTDTGRDYWAFVRAGVSASGFAAIAAIRSSTDQPEDVQILNNRVSNWAGHAFDIKGNRFRIEGNQMDNLRSFRFLTFSGNEHIIRRNVIRNCANVLHYSSAEMETLIHPAGTGWYDYQVGMLSGFTSSDGKNQNVLIEENWFENIENQIGRVDDEMDQTFGITYNKNVFIGLSAHFSGGRDGMKWTNNTFFRCTWMYAAHTLSVGGRPPVQTGYEVSGNLFIACGPPGASETLTRGFYSISSNAVNPVVNNNVVASEEVTGFAAKTTFSEPNGVNGGDPVFYSSSDFLGPDQQAFTADDGLQVLPNSPAARLGGGALGVYKVVSGKPVAHFRLTSPQGWFEPTGDDYDLQWLSKLPTQRGKLERPFDTVPRIGDAPLAVSFDASKSLSGVNGGTTTAGIVKYEWDFGDGKPPKVTTVPTVSYVFNSVGNHTVTLTVTNSVGNSHTYRNPYRVTGKAPAAPKNVRKIETE
jgi:PKD domain/Protein of unknown function (DUF1565)